MKSMKIKNNNNLHPVSFGLELVRVCDTTGSQLLAPQQPEHEEHMGGHEASSTGAFPPSGLRQCEFTIIYVIENGLDARF